MSAGQGGSYLVPAVNGFVRSIGMPLIVGLFWLCLGSLLAMSWVSFDFVRSIDLGLSAEKKKSGHVQQDVLRLLTLWFKYENRSVCTIVRRDLTQTQKRPTRQGKETYYTRKRDLLIRGIPEQERCRGGNRRWL